MNVQVLSDCLGLESAESVEMFLIFVEYLSLYVLYHPISVPLAYPMMELYSCVTNVVFHLRMFVGCRVLLGQVSRAPTDGQQPTKRALAAG